MRRKKRREGGGEERGGKGRRESEGGEILDVLQEGARRELEDKRSYLEHTPNTGFFFLKEAKIKHSRAYCLLISMCLLSLPKLKLPTNTFPTQCYESVQINMGSSETMTPYRKTSPRSLNRMQNALGFNPSRKVKMTCFMKVGGWLPLQFINMDGQAFKGTYNPVMLS